MQERSFFFFFVLNTQHKKNSLFLLYVWDSRPSYEALLLQRWEESTVIPVEYIDTLTCSRQPLAVCGCRVETCTWPASSDSAATTVSRTKPNMLPYDLFRMSTVPVQLQVCTGTVEPKGIANPTVLAVQERRCESTRILHFKSRA